MKSEGTSPRLIPVVGFYLILLSVVFTGCSSFNLPDQAFYGGGYRHIPSSDRDILQHGYMPEIRFLTNDYHLAIRTPIHIRNIRSETVDGARDSWRANGGEFAYGRPLWNSEGDQGYNRLNWEINGGFLQAIERRATTNRVRRITQFGVVEGFRRETGANKFVPTAGVGLNWMGGLKLGGGSQYSSIGFGVSAGYRSNFELDDSFYFDVSVLMGL